MNLDGVEIDIAEDVKAAVPKVVTFLSSLPAEKSTTSVDARVTALMFALDGEGVTLAELWEAARHFVKTETFYPVPAMFLRRIFARRSKARTVAVALPDGRVATVTEQEARGKYLDAWGEAPVRGLDQPPKRGLPSLAKELPEPEPKLMPDLDDPEQEERIRRQIEAIKEGGRIG